MDRDFMLEDVEVLDFELDVGVKEIYPEIENLEVTPSKEQQVFTHENSYGYDTVTVEPYTANVERRTITENGTYNASDENLDGYSSVEVAISDNSIPILDFSDKGFKNNFYSEITSLTDSDRAKITKIVNDYKQKYYPNDENINQRQLSFFLKISNRCNSLCLFSQGTGIMSSSGDIYMYGFVYEAGFIQVLKLIITGTWTNGVFECTQSSFNFSLNSGNSTYIYFDRLINTDKEQTIIATKTFNSLPKSSITPTNDNHFVNKKYVDDSIKSAITDALGGSY